MSQTKMENWKNSIWYKFSTWWNPGGDLLYWIDITIPNQLRLCKALVRREDGLIFQHTKRCYECDEEQSQRNIGKRAIQVGYFLRGKGTCGEEYDGFGSVLHRYPRPVNHVEIPKPDVNQHT